MPGKSWRQLTTDNSLQETDTYRQITGRVILQPDITQSHNYQDSYPTYVVCNTTDSLSDENKYLDRVFSKNNYNEDFIQRNTHRPTTTEPNNNVTLTTTATIPYISRILQPFIIRVAHKPISTLRQLLTNVKDKDGSSV